ncbi:MULTISPECIES: siroheme synthase CysG [unclassified Halorhodospira]|uniref:siroheme synthase CysG n=1 Tax=unclassified Halorhodospira TaxID=2626748 RepID=UPI001EE7B08C|nr:MULTISPECIES: siroheme synthase CysG [unclassified Halorhodospira]MCG5541586.1 siroheme synthase CysG [Halorhodospira sp. M39old]MCG5544649.1 siroheme synthase CysG [Halorhodospira sp. M38]
MHHYPIFLKLDGCRCLVVGGGEAAARRAGDLLRAGARVELIAPELGAPCERLLENATGELHHRAEGFAPGMEEGAALVVGATGDEATDRTIYHACRVRGIPVNVAGRPSLSTYITPVQVDRSPLQLAVSSGGAAPVLARQIASRLETLLPAAYGRLARLAGRMRERVRVALPDKDWRLRFWEQIFDGAAAESVLAGREAEGEAELLRLLEEERARPAPRGEVFLVGAGPGDPDLLTFRALRLMQRADVVLYDRLAAPALLDLVRKEAERIPVGKRRGRHTLPQERINERLIDLARSGKRVLRLKGGDPFLFGRGGEEIEGLIEHDIPFQVVPGISAAQGAASYAGIPLTHRDYAQTCRLLTGHRRAGHPQMRAHAPYREDETLIIYMGLVNLEAVCEQLRECGLPPAHPAAVVAQATTPQQRVVLGNLRTLAQRVRSERLESPALVVVGPTVQLHPRLGWYRGEAEERDAAASIDPCWTGGLNG